MPANLTPVYLEAEQRFKAAKEPKEKIEALEHMLSVIPKHKGTDHLRGDLRRKLSELRDEAVAAAKKGAARRAEPGHVPRQGAGQVVLLGASNVGKSALLRALTRAEPEVAPYPYTTRKPLPGMMMFEDAPIQLVDAPAFERAVYEPWMNTLVHNADLGLLVLDPSSPEVLTSIDEVVELTGRTRVTLVPAWWAVAAPRAAPSSGGRLGRAADDPSVPVATRALSGQELDDETLLARLDLGAVELPTVVLVNKIDLGASGEELAVIEELFGRDWPIVPVSAERGDGLERVRELSFRALRVIRVYAKPPGKPASTKAPIILPEGSTVRDMAHVIHKEIEETLRFARVWSARHFDGQRIPRDAVLEDRDIVELNT